MKKNDILVVFGELFSRGYVNGVVDEAINAGMSIIYSTVGRRDKEGHLRALTPEELKDKTQPLINIPLEAGFDLETPPEGKSPVDQLQGIKLSAWSFAKLNWDQVKKSRAQGEARFCKNLKKYMDELEKMIPDNVNVLFVHTMAGGFPRAKVVMPAANRVFKGFDERYASSEEFWNTDIGKLCEQNFNDVTGETLRLLIEYSQGIRQKAEAQNKKVSYVAYGYHGTDININGEYQWQSYSPYLQGWAKMRLENVAVENWKNDIKVTVFNSPEILTNSSSIFLGVEVALYPLISALRKEGIEHGAVSQILNKCQSLLNAKHSLEDIEELTQNYLNSPEGKSWSDFDSWPQHNGPEQMKKMRLSSTVLINMHADKKNIMTAILSEVVFKACGKIIISESWSPRNPIWWIGHDMVAQQTVQN